METLFDVTALGELLVDFTQNGYSPQNNPDFEANPGGAPANVLAMLRKLGKTCAFIGRVGLDSFGDMLEETIRQAGIDTRGLSRDETTPTTLALVSTGPDGDRSFSFYRSPGADVRLSESDLDPLLLNSCRVFHFGSLSLTDEPCRTATIAAVSDARAAGAMISFDPNLREPLWRDLEEAKAQISWGMKQCDILKIADNELHFMTGETDHDTGAAILRKAYPNIRLLNVTAGASGSYSYYEDLSAYEPACALGGVIEATGAGDSFCACVLNYVVERGFDDLSEENLHDMLRFSNAAAYLVTTRKGAFRSMPELEEVQNVLNRMSYNTKKAAATICSLQPLF